MLVDASVWVSRFLSSDVHYPVSRGWIEAYLANGGLIVGPVLLLAEVGGAVARRTGESRLGQQAVAQLLRLPRLRLILMDTALAQSAAELAAQLQLRGADAVYVAAAHRLNIPLVTWDREQRERTASTVVAHTPDQIHQ